MGTRKNINAINFSQKIKVLTKLNESGYNTEKQLLSLTMEDILKINGITISDISTIIEFQKSVKAHRFFSYLGEHLNHTESSKINEEEENIDDSKI